MISSDVNLNQVLQRIRRRLTGRETQANDSRRCSRRWNCVSSRSRLQLLNRTLEKRSPEGQEPNLMEAML